MEQKCMMIFACVNKGTFIFMQSLGKAVASTVLSMVREVPTATPPTRWSFP